MSRLHGGGSWHTKRVIYIGSKFQERVADSASESAALWSACWLNQESIVFCLKPTCWTSPVEGTVEEGPRRVFVIVIIIIIIVILIVIIVSYCMRDQLIKDTSSRR